MLVIPTKLPANSTIFAAAAVLANGNEAKVASSSLNEIFGKSGIGMRSV